MTMSLPASPAAAVPLIEHLATWGEVAVYEARGFAAAAQWLEVLAGAGLVEEICEHGGEVAAWSLSRKGEALLDAKPDTAARLALFQVPAYRAYLVGILAEGLALAAKAEMRDQLEGWTGAELDGLLPEINDALDDVESAGRLIDVSRVEIERRCGKLPGRSSDYGGWDQVLLGRAGRPQDLFDFVLRKFAPLAMLPPATHGAGLAVVLRPLPITSDDGSDVGSTPKQSGWNIRRLRIHSSICLFDHHGQCLYDPNLRADDVLRPALQDALVEHPFYGAIVNLAICAWRSPATTMQSVALKVPNGSELGDIRLFVGPRDVGALRERMRELVAQQGVRVRGLSNGVVPMELMNAVVRGLIEHEVLRRVEGEIQLHPDYQSSLMAARLRSVFRPGKEIQKRMLEWLGDQERTSAVREAAR